MKGQEMSREAHFASQAPWHNVRGKGAHQDDLCGKVTRYESGPLTARASVRKPADAGGMGRPQGLPLVCVQSAFLRVNAKSYIAFFPAPVIACASLAACLTGSPSSSSRVSTRAPSPSSTEAGAPDSKRTNSPRC